MKYKRTFPEKKSYKLCDPQSAPLVVKPTVRFWITA